MMKLPWHNRTGYAKAMAILATVLTISIGLCGANFFAVIRFAGPLEEPSETPRWPMKLLAITGWTEIIAILLSLLGLGLVAALASRQRRKNRKRSGNQKGTD